MARGSSSTALSELLEGLRKKRASWDNNLELDQASTVSLPIYQTTAASSLRQRTSTFSPDSNEVMEEAVRPGILKAPSPSLSRASSLRSLSESIPTVPLAVSGGGKINRFSSCDSITSAASSTAPRQQLSNLSIPEEEDSSRTLRDAGSYQPIHRRMHNGMATEVGDETFLGKESLVFQNRHFACNIETDKERVSSDSNLDNAPVIRRSQSISSLVSVSSRGGQRRTLSVHFGELPPSRASFRDSDSDSDSSGSGGLQQKHGPQGERLEAEGSEGDITSVMKKYLRKADID